MEPLNAADIDPQHQDKLFVQDYSSQQRIDGVQLVDCNVFTDDGGYFLELSRLTNGRLREFPDCDIKQINVSQMEPGVIKATHLHFQQEDIWFVPPSQRLLIGLIDVRKESPTNGVKMRFVLGGGRARLLYIPRGVGHGAANLWQQPANIMYFVNNEFSPEADKTDEHRLPWDIFGEGFWELSRE